MKKTPWLIGLMVPSVLAESSFDIPDALEGFLIWLFETLPDGIRSSDQVAVLYFKLLLWILVFAALYHGGTAIFKDNNKLAGVIAFVLSLGGVVLIPNQLVVVIFETYAIIIAILLALIPLFIAIYFNKKVLSGSDSWKRVLRGLVFIFMAIIIWYLAALIEGGVILG